MADPKHTFLSWARRGLGSLVSGTAPNYYASLPMSMAVNNAPITMPSVRLYGPGDITSIDPRAVIRTEPRDGTAAFEPNYLPAIEFRYPDFPWLFTPSGPSGDRLRPWICLVVVPEVDGVSLTEQPNRAAVLRIGPPLHFMDELPHLDHIDFWAHTQITGETALEGDPSARLSRLIAPRALEAGTRYLACVVPTYLAGVKAGLGLPVSDNDVGPAWDASTNPPLTLPAYCHFRFQTGPEGDFASLARRIVPPKTPVDAGIRMMDVSQPGFGTHPIPGVKLGLEGAIRSINGQSTPWPTGAQAKYEALLRAALTPPTTPLPVVAPPVYGSTQSGQPLPAANVPPVWLRELNLDPRNRAAAGAGTQVIQRDQEKLVASAWTQAGDLRTVNQLLRQAQLALHVSASLFRRHLETIPEDGVYLQLTAPTHSRVLFSNVTVRSATLASRLPVAAVSAPMRKLARPRGPVGRQVYRSAKPQIVERLNTPPGAPNALAPAGPVAPPRGMVALDDISPAIRIANMTPSRITAAPGFAAPIPSGNADRAPVGAPAAQPPATIQDPAGAPLRQITIDWNTDPNVPDFFKGTRPNLPSPFVFPRDAAGLQTMQEHFRAAAVLIGSFLNTPSTPPPDPPPLGNSPALTPARNRLRTQLNPETSIVTRLRSRIALPAGPDPLAPQTGAPEFPTPMYEALAQLSPDWMLPGISNVPLNSAVLMRTNPPFVEAFLAGLNEEMARELLWREFPIARHATYFRHFWRRTDGAEDIPSIDGFDASLSLGQHTKTGTPGGDQIFLIRADLFRRYPNSVVSAVRAAWASDQKTRVLGTEKRDPIFRGQIGTDITFFGFSVDDPKGADNAAAGSAGWYFLIEEHPTEPHYGLEPSSSTAPIQYWNDVRWSDVTLKGKFLSPDPATPAPPPQEPAPKVVWGHSAAAMAYILTRRPVRVAFHGRALIA